MTRKSFLASALSILTFGWYRAKATPKPFVPVLTREEARAVIAKCYEGFPPFTAEEMTNTPRAVESGYICLHDIIAGCKQSTRAFDHICSEINRALAHLGHPDIRVWCHNIYSRETNPDSSIIFFRVATRVPLNGEYFSVDVERLPPANQHIS